MHVIDTNENKKKRSPSRHPRDPAKRRGADVHFPPQAKPAGLGKWDWVMPCNPRPCMMTGLRLANRRRRVFECGKLPDIWWWYGAGISRMMGVGKRAGAGGARKWRMLKCQSNCCLHCCHVLPDRGDNVQVHVCINFKCI